jgi:hypothetical protein
MHKIAYEICTFFSVVIPLDPWQLGAMPPDPQGKGRGRKGKEGGKGEGEWLMGRRSGEGRRKGREGAPLARNPGYATGASENNR